VIVDRTTDEVPLDGFDLVIQHHELGWILTKTLRGENAPVDPRWQAAPPPTPDDLRSWFATGA
jgi:hypothetical protein